MNKKEILKTLDIAGFVSLAVAPILVFIFQFTGNAQVVKTALVMYAVAFLIITTFYSIKLFFGCKGIKENNEFVVIFEDKQKAITIAKLVCSALVFVFSLVVVILY